MEKGVEFDGLHAMHKEQTVSAVKAFNRFCQKLYGKRGNENQNLEINLKLSEVTESEKWRSVPHPTSRTQELLSKATFASSCEESLGKAPQLSRKVSYAAIEIDRTKQSEEILVTIPEAQNK